MAITVTMPQLGETVTEGTILSWAKAPGDTIAEDEVLLEISTDKVDTEVPSPAGGVIQEILVAEGETVTVGTPLAVIGEPGEAAGDAGAPDSAQEPPAPPEVAAVPEAAPTAPAAPEIAEQPPTEPVHAPAATSEPPAERPAPTAPQAAEPPAAAPAVAAAMAPPVPTDDAPRRGVLSPVVRKLAAEHDIDLNQVVGTGDGGRITRSDVMAYIDSGGAKVAVEPAAPPAPEPVAPVAEAAGAATAPAEAEVPAEDEMAPVAAESEPEPAAAEAEPEPSAAPPVAPAAAATAAAVAPAVVPSAEPAPAPESAPETAPVPVAPAAAAASAEPAPMAGGDEVREIGRLRRRIADNMVMAKATAAHVWTSVEVDYHNVERVRLAHKESFKAQHGFSLTYLPFIARATMDALHAFPVVNSAFHLEEGEHVFHRDIDLGVAVDMNQGGLVVVTVRDADNMRMTPLAKEIREKAIKARDGALQPDDVAVSTFTITNPGPFGSFMSAPIINVPNAAILSTDTVAKRPAVLTLPDGTDMLGIRPIGYLGLTWDHRVFDGSTAVLFLQRIKHNLESWDWEQELS